MTIFLPKQIHIGFQKRGGTYTGKLAYVIYTDEKGILRKETSWQGWRDKSIEPVIADNEPTSGFVLNKKVGGYSTGWNHRQSYTRIYDPRGFEFEITIENLLYILENTNSIKGKGLEGEFVYGWSGTDLLLIPTSSPDYTEMVKYRDIMFNNTYLKAKELIPGNKYLTKDNKEIIFLGKYDFFEHNYYNKSYDNSYLSTDMPDIKNKGKVFYFAGISSYDKKLEIDVRKTVTKYLISDLGKCDAEEFATAFDLLEHKEEFSPLSKLELYDYKDFDEYLEQDAIAKANNPYSSAKIYINSEQYFMREAWSAETFDNYKCQWLRKVLTNGKTIDYTTRN